MPPAVVDFRSSTAPSSPIEPKRSPARNPSITEISTPRFVSSDGCYSSRPNPGSLPGSVHQSDLGQGPKDAGLNGSSAFVAPSVPSSPFHAVSGSRKPASSAGRSKPRFVKLRRHFNSTRVRPAVPVDADDCSGFNPFHSRLVGVDSNASEGNQGGGVHGLKEKLNGWKPFESEAGLKVSEDSNSGNFNSANSENPASVMINVGGFVFGSSAKKGSRTGKKKIVSSSIRYGSSKSVKQVVHSDVEEGTFCFNSVANGGPDLVSSSGIRKNPISEQVSSENSNNNNNNKVNSAPMKSESANFVFGCPDFVFSSGITKDPIPEHVSSEKLSFHNKMNSAPMKLDGANFLSGAPSVLDLGGQNNGPANMPDYKPNSGACIFKSGLKQCSKSCQDSLEDSNDSFEFGKSGSPTYVFGKTSVFPSGTKNIGSNRMDGISFGTSTFGNFNSKGMDSKDRINSDVSEGNGEPNAGFSVCGSGIGLSSSLDQNSSTALDVGSVPRFNGETRNLQTSGNEADKEEIKKPAWRTEVNQGNVFVIGRSQSSLRSSGGTATDKKIFGTENSFTRKKKGGVRNKAFDKGVMPCGFGAKIDSNLGEISSFVSDDCSSFNLPEDITNLNFQSSGNKNDCIKTKQDDQRSKVNGNNVFLSGCNTNAQSYFTALGNDKLTDSELRDAPRKGNETISVSMANEDHQKATFVFGSTLKKATSVEMSSSDIHFQKSKIGFENDIPSGRIKDTGYPSVINMKNGLNEVTSGSNCKVPGSLEDPKLNITDKTGNAADKLQSPASPSLGFHSDFKFNFPGGKQETIPYMNDTELSKNDHHSGLREKTTPLDPSSSDHITQSVATDFTFTGTCKEFNFPHMEFFSSIQVTPGLSKESLFTGLHENRSFNMKKGESRTTRKKGRVKTRLSVPLHQNVSKTFASAERVTEETTEKSSPSGYSPMDYSPYQENLVVDQGLGETAVTSDQSNNISSSCESIAINSSIPVDVTKDDAVSATHHLDASKDFADRSFVGKSFFIGKQVLENDNCGFTSNNAGVTISSVPAGSEAETASCSPKFEPKDSKSGKCFTLNSGGSYFTSDALFFAQSPVSLSVSKRQHRRKGRTKGSKNLSMTKNANAPFAPPSENMFPVTGSLPVEDLKRMPSVPQCTDNVKPENNMKEKIDSRLTNTATSEQEACHKLRQRGNKAYLNGDISKAEELYTRGLNSISKKEVPDSSNRALMLCYSNRAAARMSLGRMREALSDCMMAVAIDPSFVKAQVRAGNCYLALGEVQDALNCFKNCLQQENDGSLYQKIFVEASDGLLKTQQVVDYVIQSEELMLRRSSTEAAKALQLISEALLICPYSENLMERKAEALLLLRSYEEAVLFCEQTIENAERNSSQSRVNTENYEDLQICSVRLWRWCIMSKSYFYLGRFAEALELLKHEHVRSKLERNENKSSESSTSLFDTINELLRLKVAGNDAFQAGKHLDAVEHYSAAIACNTESRPFTAICFCNRAAAYQALGQITDAIADCSIAIALNASYAKAISRRATLHEMIRDFDKAANDLRRLIAVLEKQFKDKGNQAGILRRTSCNSDLSQAHARLRSVEEEAKKEIPLDLYMILSIEQSSSAADIKKAYRKAALRHHPDKAGQFLVRSENNDDGIWREVVDEVHKDADSLFKIIGEAYTVLSDPTKRLQYDAEEEIRSTLRKGGGARYTSKTQDHYGSPKSNYRHHSGAHGSSNSRRSESYRILSAGP
ncbi:hypothetical protein Cni_G04724 [Canna indica]|uniref:J domain-containing protein n=1 Tax=Canna indica TaxID=4628 RepID=A0AAQ3JVW9_9LILI|nr:hypothetical protein Cni_G04724 [Canna indica]